MKESPRTGALTVGARVLWRQLRSAPGAGVTIFVATLLTALFVTAVPRVIERVSEDDLRATLVEAVPEQRNVRAESFGWFRQSRAGEPFAELAQRTDRVLEEGFPASVRSTIAETQYVVDSPEFGIVSFPEGEEEWFSTTFRFRYQQGIEDHLTVVEGALPQEGKPIAVLYGEDCPDDRLATEDFKESSDVACTAVEIPVFETAITTETATAMSLEVGDVIAEPGITDEFHAAHGETFAVAISGIIELSDLSEEYWYADASLHRPRIEENPDFRLVFATGLMHPDDYAEMLTTIWFHEFEYTWRYFVDPGLVEAANASELRGDVARIVPPLGEDIITSLDDLITTYLDQRTLTIGLMSTVVTGVMVVAVGLVLVLAALIADRHARGTVLIRDRGASRGQTTLSIGYTGLALVVPAALVGFLVTNALVPGTGFLTPGRGSAALALGGAAATVVAGWPYAFGRLGALQRADAAMVVSSSGKRVVAEVFVVIAAVVSVFLLRRRGLADPAAAAPEGIDGLLAIAPAVIAVAVGLVTLRLLGPLMRMLSWLGARRRDATLFVGFRRLISQPPASRAPVVVVLVAVAVAVFSSVVRVAIDEGQDRHSWQVVGGDFRVEAPTPGLSLPADLDPAALSGGRPWAEGALFANTPVIGLDGRPNVLAIDVASYQQVLSGSGSEIPALGTLADAGGGDGPAPVLVSSRWTRAGGPGLGTEFALEMGSADPAVVVAALVESFPALPVTEPFVIIGLDDLRHAWGELAVPRTVLYLSGGASDTTRIAESLAGRERSAVFISRHDVRSELDRAPFSTWLIRGLDVAFYIAVLFGVVASLSLLTVTANRRRRDLVFLRTLGLTRRQATIITALEQIPPLVVATLLGAITGGVMARLLTPALNFEAFTGGLLPVETVVDPGGILLLTTVLLLILVAFSVTFVAATGDREHAELLRVGD